MIDIVDKQVKGPDSLFEASLYLVPFVRRDDARYGIKRHDAFHTLPTAIDGEGDTLLAHRQIGQAMASFQICRLYCFQLACKFAVGEPRFTSLGHHFVPA